MPNIIIEAYPHVHYDYVFITMLVSNMSAFKQNAGAPDGKLLSENINFELTRIKEWLALNKLNLNISKTKSIYIYNSVLTCRKNIINSSASAPLNATKIAVKKVSDVDVCMFGPEF